MLETAAQLWYCCGSLTHCMCWTAMPHCVVGWLLYDRHVQERGWSWRRHLRLVATAVHFKWCQWVVPLLGNCERQSVGPIAALPRGVSWMSFLSHPRRHSAATLSNTSVRSFVSMFSVLAGPFWRKGVSCPMEAPVEDRTEGRTAPSLDLDQLYYMHVANVATTSTVYVAQEGGERLHAWLGNARSNPI